MATVGQQLTAPEAGWKRYDDSSYILSYVGDSWGQYTDNVHYNGSVHYTFTSGDYVTFNFTGSKLRLIGSVGTATYRSNSASIYIDGILVGIINQVGTSFAAQVLDFSIDGLSSSEHYVKIINNQTTPVKAGTGYILDAIDIDSTGELKPPQDLNKHGLLRITMNDSSEREYELSLTEIDDFVTWCDRAVGTGSSLYVFDKTYNVGEFKNRKEYLLFEKIISFEVMELTK